MSNRRKAKDELELKLLEVTEDSTYRKDQKKRPRSRDVAVESEAIVVLGSVKKHKTLH